MRTIFTAVIFFLLSVNVFAQSNFYKIGLGGGAGLTQAFADVQKHSFGLAGYGTAEFFFTPFISMGLEVQAGEINGGDVYTDPYHRQFINSYKAITTNGKLYLGALVNDNQNKFLNAVKGLYAGAGIGMIQNKMKGIVRNEEDSGTAEGNDDTFPGNDQSKDIIIPLQLGISFYLTNNKGFNRYALNFNYQSNFSLGEGLDGYDDSVKTLKRGHYDIYTYFSVGLKYLFGPMGYTNRRFHKY